MPSENELREGLQQLSAEIPHRTEADLWTARDEGRRRLTRRRARRGLVVALILVVAVGAGLSISALDDDADVEAADGPAATQVTGVTAPTSSSRAVWIAPADDPTAPSPTAVAVGREQWTIPDGLEDCGVHIRTSGWPTTAPADPRPVECFLDAIAADRAAAQFVTTARDFAGGMTGTIYRVRPSGSLVAIDFDVAADGTVTRTTTTCADIQGVANSVDLECIATTDSPIDESDPTSPTEAAVAADRVRRLVPTGYEDCGSVRITVGWPTTFAFFGSTDCLLAAAAAGRPAQYSTAARDFVGGITGTIFRVEGPGQITIQDYRVNSFGSIGEDDSHLCASLDEKFPVPECT